MPANPSPPARQLGGASPAARLAALRAQHGRHLAGQLPLPQPGGFVNNHIHSIYSFSPYSPSGAVYQAWLHGLATAGLVDHDSIAGAGEFTEAGRIVGLATTVGFELRCSMAGTPFAARHLNNPDQPGIAYVVCHGVPRGGLARAEAFLAPLRQRRMRRSRAMLARINRLVGRPALHLNFDRDVLPLSQAAEGGGLTERHLLYALALRMEAALGRGAPVLAMLEEGLGLAVAENTRRRLLQPEGEDYAYTLLGALKAGFVERFYIEAGDELCPVADFTALAAEIGGIAAYPYLGDVEASVTGDKKPGAFEDAYLDELVAWLPAQGFTALSYMPSRNTPAQLRRLMALAAQHGLLEVSGEDINSPGQPFVCEALARPEYRHLENSTWALIGHERAASQDVRGGMFSPESIAAMPGLAERTAHFAAIGRSGQQHILEG